MAQIDDIQALLETVNAALPSKVTILGPSAVDNIPPSKGVVCIDNSGKIYQSIGKTSIDDWKRLDGGGASGLDPQGDWLVGTGAGYTPQPTLAEMTEDKAGQFWVVVEIENNAESFTWVNPNNDGVDIEITLGDWAYWNGVAWSKITNLISNSYTKNETDTLVNARVLQTVYDIFVTNTNNSLSDIDKAFGGYIDKTILSVKGTLVVGTGELETIDGISRPIITAITPGTEGQLMSIDATGMPIWKNAPNAEPIIVKIENLDNQNVTLFDMDGIGKETVSMRIRAEEDASSDSIFFDLAIINDNGVIKHTISNIIGELNFDIEVDETTTKEINLINIDNNWGEVRYYIIKF